LAAVDLKLAGPLWSILTVEFSGVLDRLRRIVVSFGKGFELQHENKILVMNENSRFIDG